MTPPRQKVEPFVDSAASKIFTDLAIARGRVADQVVVTAQFTSPPV
jgi:hypothetical protein